jgi:predicted nucleic acid-binding protein
VPEGREPADRSHEVTSDLVEYVIVAVPDQDSLATVVPALAELVQTAKIRILDLVVLVRDREGAVTVLEFEDVESMAALRRVEGEVGGMLSDHDIALASTALRPGTAGIVLVTEDRWAEPLSAAARRAGGQIIGGERIPPSRVEGALADRSEDEQEGG